MRSAAEATTSDTLSGRSERHGRQFPWLGAGLLITGVVPAFALALAGIAKTYDPIWSAQFISQGLRISLQDGLNVARSVATVELVVGIGLCLFIARSRIPGLIAVALFAFYIGVQFSVQQSDPQAATCGCFGSLMGAGMAKRLWLQIAINSTLLLLAVLHVLLVPRRAAVTPVPPPAPFTAD
jgi:hypothetical protein